MGDVMSADFITQMSVILRRAGSLKTISRKARRSDRTVERWYQGKGEMSASALVNLMGADEEIFIEIARLAGRATEAQRMRAAEMLRRALAAMGEPPA